MSVVFGWYSFKIKSYTPEDLGLENENNEDVTFEVRQKCFHLFWIPFFGLEIIYGLRKNGELYEIPQEYITRIDAKGEVKTPWYSYSILIIAAIWLVGALVFMGFDALRYGSQNDNQHDQFIAQLDNRLEHLEPGNYLSIKSIIDRGTDDTFIKITSVNGEQIEFVSMQVDDYQFESNPFEINKHFEAKANTLDTLTAPLNHFEQMICRDYDIYHGYYDFGFPILKGNDTKYTIEEIGDLKGPSLVLESHGGARKIKLLNFGTPLDLTTIETIEGDAQWETKLPLHYSTDISKYDSRNDNEISCVNCDYDSEYKVKFTVEDSNKNTYTYTITRTASKSFLNKVF